MAKRATKAVENNFYKARMAAATCNDSLNSREGAAELLGIDRTRLARIELGSLNPYPEEVLLMSDAYNAPELNNYYCSKMCPLGRHTVPAAELLNLDRLTIKILSALGSAEFIQKTILEVVKDGERKEAEATALMLEKRIREYSQFLEQQRKDLPYLHPSQPPKPTSD